MLTPELVSILMSLITGMIGGAGITLTLFKKQLASAAGALTPAELLEIVYEIKKALALAGPGGSEITDEEARLLGKKIWEAFRK